MKIAYLLTRSDSIGGAQIHVRDMAREMQRRGHEVTVIIGGTGSFLGELRRADICYISIPHLIRSLRPHLDLCAIVEIYAALRRIRPDLISTHSSKAGILGRIAGRMLGIPVLFTAHGFAFTEGVRPRVARIYRWVEKLAAPLAARVITVSECDRLLALSARIVSHEKILTIHNGMPDVARRLHSDPGKRPPRLVTVARFEKQKDFATLLQALAELLHLEWSLSIVGGGGPVRESVEIMLDDLALRDRVEILGQRNDVAEILSGAQIFLLISHFEGFPRSILEAMRAGLSVIASDVGGCGESVVDGETGYLVPRLNAEALKDCLATLLGDPALRSRMGARGRRRYEEHFTFGQMFEKTWRVYEDVMSST